MTQFQLDSLMASSSSPSSQTRFSALPDVVLDRIRVSVAGNIASHIALSQTCRRWRDLYREDSCWQFACFKAGFGRPRRRRLVTADGDFGAGPKWRELAYLLVAHPDRCEIKSCKDANGYFGMQAFSSDFHALTAKTQRDIMPVRCAPPYEIHYQQDSLLRCTRSTFTFTSHNILLDRPQRIHPSPTRFPFF